MGGRRPRGDARRRCAGVGGARSEALRRTDHGLAAARKLRRLEHERRAEPRLAAAVPALDRARAAAERRGGGRAGQADRARRHGRQAAHGRGQPAPGRVDRQGLHRARADVPRPDPGGLARADQGGREVRLPARLQVLDLRDLVDPPGRDPRDRRQGTHDQDPRAHGRAPEQAGPRRTPADPAARARAERRGDRRRARVLHARGARGHAHGPAAGVAGETGRRGGRLSAGRPHRGRVGRNRRSRSPPRRCAARTSTRVLACLPGASAR